MDRQQDSLYSCHREKLIEHLFLAEVMKRLWLRGTPQLDVLRPQVDNSGYDLALEFNGVLRHVQLKSSHRNASRAHVDIGLRLTRKPSGCVIWVFFEEETLELGPFLWFGAPPGKELSCIDDLKISKHTKANSQGVKTQRPGLRQIPKSRFEKVSNIDELLIRLFGEVTADSTFIETPESAAPTTEAFSGES